MQPVPDISARKRRLRHGRLTLALASTLLCLATGEIFLRWFSPVRGHIYQLDDVRLHKHLPGSRKVYRHPPGSGGGWVMVHINREGRRGPLSAPPEVPKVLVYGDSFIAAEYSRLEDTFAARLEHHLRGQTGAVLQVLNCGISAYGPDQVALAMAEDLPALKPQLVIAALYAGNDFGDLLRNKLFKLDAEGKLARQSPVLADALKAHFAEAGRQSSFHLVRLGQTALSRLSRPQGSAPSQSPTVPDLPLMEQWLAMRRAEYGNFIENGDLRVTNLLEDGYDADVSLEPRSPSATYRRQLMGRVIEQLRDIASRNNVPLLLLLIPAPFDVVDDYELKPDVAKHPDYQPGGLTDALEAAAREAGVPHLNLFKPFQQAGASALYFRGGNDHWNSAGQELAARLAADFLRERQLLSR
jgi:lysophospholipase L1-like esterase